MTDDITLDDVARQSGVSRATASRALNGRSGVRDDVRERVRMIADALGYRPHRAAKNLAGGRTSVIGLVVGSDDLVGDIYAQALLQAVANAADRHDEGLMLIMDSKTPNEAVRNLLHDGLVDGVIISAVAAGERWVEGLLDNKMPTVLVGGHPRRHDVPVIDTEGTEATAELTEHLFEHGAERVAYVAGRPGRVDSANRLAGYRLAHERRGLAIDESLVLQGDFNRSTAYELGDEVLALGVDGVVCGNDETGFGLLDRAGELGVTSPDDLLVVGFDGIAPARAPYDLTTMEQPFSALADCAIRSLVSLVDGGPVAMEQLVAPTFRQGVTTARPTPESSRCGATPP